jgi:type I restriction enzyme S subunit
MSVLESIDLTNAIESKIDRSKWVKWKFSDLVENIVEKVIPKDSGLEHYIGLEHLDSGSLKIRRFGETESLIGDKLKIYKGDLIFAKRNAYLKRVAIADFDAVASAHSLVLRPKSKNVLPEFLPFFLLSEVFWERAIEISVGSLSPTINWKVLAKQEFLLPPKEEQAKLAKLLWAMDEVIEREKEVGLKLSISRDAYFENLILEMKGKKVKLSKILIPKNEKSQVPHKRDKYIGLEHIESGEYYSNKFDNTIEVKAQCNIVNEGDLCYSKLRPYLDKAIIAKFNAISSTELLVYDTMMVSKEYVLYHIHSRPFLNYITGQCFGTKMPRVSHKIIGDFDILVPNDESSIIAKMNEFLKNSEMVKAKIIASQTLQKSLINQVF